MASKLKILNKNLKGFSLVELLIALGIFAIIVSANFALAMNAYRGRANDRVRLEAGLVIKDTVNGVYAYKNNNWSDIIAGMEDSGSGVEPKRLDLVNDKFQLNSGGWSSNGVNFNMYINKASRVGGDISPGSVGGDPDTVKVTIVASWTDFLGIQQEITENYFLSNWASLRWTETLNAEFLDGSPAPVLKKTKVENDSVSLGNETVYANNDWCNLVNNVTVKNVNTGADTAFVLGSKREQTSLGYRVYEPEATFPPPMPEAPDPPAASTITLNNTNPTICNESSGIPILECETLVKFYKSLGGEGWNDKTGWETISTGSSPTSPCTWHGVTCADGHVTKISFANNALAGSIPREIGNLTKLEEFKMYHDSKNNQFVGSIPPEIGLLTDLEWFELVNVAVSGRLPETIGNLTNLDQLNLRFTNITGKLPASIGRLQNLSRLDLFSSRFVCHIPPEITLINPSYLNIGGNNWFVNTRYSEIFDKINSHAGVFFPPPSWIEEDAFLDCAIAPAESNLTLSQSTSTVDSLSEISLPNSDFSPEVFIDSIPDGTNNTYGSWTSKSFQFTNDIVTIPYKNNYNLGQGEGTISIWIRSDASNAINFARIFDYSDSSSNGGFLSFGSGGELNRIRFYHYGANDITLLSPSDLIVGQWTHVAIVMRGNNAKMYINGTEVASDSFSGLSYNASNNLYLGNNSGLSLPATVTLDELRIYNNRALTSDEINDTKYFEVDRGDTGLTGYWRMDHPTDLLNQTVYDYSYQENHGILGVSSGNLANDPVSVDGQVQYRINDIYHYKEKIYFATTNPLASIMVYDKYDQDGAIWKGVDLGLSNNNLDTQAIFIEGDTAYALQDSFLVEIELTPDSYGPPDSVIATVNLNQGGTGISSPTSIRKSGNRLYVTGLDPLRSLMVLDVTNGLSQSSIETVKNILLDTYL